MKRVNLPEDGASYKCTFSHEGWECPKPAYEGLIEEDYDNLRNDPRLTNVSFMRALCATHLRLLETYLP